MKTLLIAVGIAGWSGALAAAPAELPKTGQTVCSDTSGLIIPCASTGQDGDLQKGIPLPSSRFTADSTGNCMTDHLTGLMWVRSPDAIVRNWQQALDHASNLTLCGFSDWRLPNRNELKSLVNYGHPDLAAWLNSQGFSNVQAAHDYWSSTSSVPAFNAWEVRMGSGHVNSDHKASGGLVWPVRSGR